MDPVTAWAEAVKAVAEMITEIVKGMPQDKKEQVWDWYIADQRAWRKFWKLPDADQH